MNMAQRAQLSAQYKQGYQDVLDALRATTAIATTLLFEIDGNDDEAPGPLGDPL